MRDSVASFPRSLLRLWRHLSARRQRQFMLLLGLVVLSTFAEVVSLGTVLPFLAVLADPESAFSHPIVATVGPSLGIAGQKELVLALTVTFVTVAVLAGAIRMLLLWASTRLAFATGADLGIEVYRRTLYQPYKVHVARNSSEVISGITKKVDGVVFYVLVPSLTLLSSSLQILAITAVLFVIDPTVAFLAIVSFGGGYGAIAWLSRRRLRQCSQLIAHEQTQVIKALQEGLGGVRDVLLDGTQATYCSIYRRADVRLRRAQSYVVFAGGSPRYAMEALGMVLIAALALWLSQKSGGISAALPLLGALALAAQRILPAMQQSYAAWANMVASHAFLQDTIGFLEQPMPRHSQQPDSPSISFGRNIELRDIRFRYTDSSPWVLDGLTLELPKGGRIGFVGTTGSGKSTLMDVLMGLLVPISGEIAVDGLVLCADRIQAWQRSIAHVPQDVFLADSTIAENIAFGVPVEAIDMHRVQDAARQAQIATFIESRPGGYNALVGERGIGLSGGQRQRIGIARALYKRAAVLVLDEATSALDSMTERSVMDAVQALSRELTVLVIAHRISTVQHCDAIVELKDGRVAAQGTYDQLIQRSPSFRELVQSSH